MAAMLGMANCKTAISMGLMPLSFYPPKVLSVIPYGFALFLDTWAYFQIFINLIYWSIYITTFCLAANGAGEEEPYISFKEIYLLRKQL